MIVFARAAIFVSLAIAIPAGFTACSSSSSSSEQNADASIGTDDDAGSSTDAAISADGSIADDGGSVVVDAGPDGGCFVSTVGVFGECMTTTDCAALGDHTSTPGYCPGAADIECCSQSPNVADNPAVPVGWKLMAQADVTPDMTTWAVTILQHPTTYPMFSSTTQMFGPLLVMARVEWHPPDMNNETIHRGVTLYEPTD
jgi:hypothetical protein